MNVDQYFNGRLMDEESERELQSYAKSLVKSRFNNYHGFWGSVWQIVKGYRFRKEIKTRDALKYAERIGLLPAEKMNIDKILLQFNLKRGND